MLGDLHRARARVVRLVGLERCRALDSHGQLGCHRRRELDGGECSSDRLTRRHRDDLRLGDRSRAEHQRQPRRRGGLAVDLGDVGDDLDRSRRQRLRRRSHGRDHQVGAQPCRRRAANDERPRRRLSSTCTCTSSRVPRTTGPRSIVATPSRTTTFVRWIMSTSVAPGASRRTWTCSSTRNAGASSIASVPPCGPVRAVSFSAGSAARAGAAKATPTATASTTGATARVARARIVRAACMMLSSLAVAADDGPTCSRGAHAALMRSGSGFSLDCASPQGDPRCVAWSTLLRSRCPGQHDRGGEDDGPSRVTFAIAALACAVAAAGAASATSSMSAPSKPLPRGGKVVARIAIPQGSGGFALGEGAVWAMSDDVSTLTRIDPRGNTVAAKITVKPVNFCPQYVCGEPQPAMVPSGCPACPTTLSRASTCPPTASRRRFTSEIPDRDRRHTGRRLGRERRRAERLSHRPRDERGCGDDPARPGSGRLRPRGRDRRCRSDLGERLEHRPANRSGDKRGDGDHPAFRRALRVPGGHRARGLGLWCQLRQRTHADRPAHEKARREGDRFPSPDRPRGRLWLALGR